MDRTRTFFIRLAGVVSALPLLIAASAASASLPQSVFNPAGPVARTQVDLLKLTLGIVIMIWVVVGAIMLYTVIRFRAKPGDPIPKQIHGNTRLEIVWTVVPIILLAIMAVPTVRDAFTLASPPTDDVLEVRVVGYQWWWAFEYPDLGIVTANEMRIPAGKAVNLTLESADVVHSFWVPRLAGKVDVVPNRQNTMWIQADEPGDYWGQCAEYCGTSHANMRFLVVALEQEEFDEWVASRQAVTEFTPSNELSARGHELFVTGACLGCHTVDGTVAQGIAGPDLTDFSSRKTLAAGIRERTDANVADWLRNPPEIKPGSKMPPLGLSEPDIEALVAFLNDLK